MSEAKQLPRLAIARPPAGPAIIVMGTRSKKSSVNYRIGNVVPAILPMYSPSNFQRPGDVYRPLSKSSSRHTPRPLGLIPERQEYTNQLPSRFSSALLYQPSKFKQENDDRGNKYDATKPSTAVPATRLKPLNGQYRAKSALIFGENIQSSTTNPSILYEETDPDYMDMLARLDERTTPIPLQLSQSSPEHRPEHSRPYTYSHDNTSYQKHRHSVYLPIKSTKSSNRPSRSRAQSLRPYSEPMDSTIEYKYQQQSGHAAQYINFVEQASLNHRHLGMDKRDGIDYIPCERCRLRGGRCSNCKVIRIGGGYIVLDGDDESMRRGYSLLNGDSSSHHLPALTEDNNQEMDGLSHNRNQGDNLGQGNNSGRGKGSTDDLDGNNNRWGQGIGSHGNNNDTSGSKVTQDYSNNNLTANRSSSSGLGSGDSNMGRRSGVRLSQSGTGSDMDTTDGLGQGKGSTSRPGSSHQVSSRPVSSRNRIGSGIGNRRSFDGKNRKGGTSTSMDKNHGGRRKKKSGDSSSDDGSSDDDDDEKRRRKKKDGNLPDIDEDDSKKKKQVKDINLHGKYGEDSETEQGLKYMGSLHKFKSKEDNVKALKCTLKELHGIDPLDYLAKYCIIDQSKLPNYQRVYDNVDRDEDDEIDINELDFALKAVNYDLISDAELEYVNQILELSSRYKLNFHLFSVIAALSEKVVALEDMVKKLINKMDFKALETKMKKCKELFYLLDDMDSGERDGVVTVASLAVELQAGGLTEEHVEFVVDRLNRDNKGLVEFLDYLTYVPLFVEIHDSVCGNPLDFTRTK